MKQIIKKYLFEYTENSKIIFFRYLCTGGTVTVINMILLYLFTELANINYAVSNVISMLICIVITYITSKKIVFVKKVKIGMIKEFLIYVVISIISITIDTIIMYILTEKLKIYYLLSKVFATFVSTIFNYISKKITYDKFKC